MSFSRPGLLTCARYAFAPNSLHYCGPEKQTDLIGYLQNQESDQGLAEIICHFETLYPYLKLIAIANNLQDPFDPRVVAAYWLGNKLLNRVKTQSFIDHLSESLQLKKKLPRGKISPMLDRVVSGLPNHTSHVLNIYKRTGHLSIEHTLETMDNCRISWAKILFIMPNKSNLSRSQSRDSSNLPNWTNYIVKTRSLTYLGDRLILGPPHHRQVASPFTKPKVGDWVSLHWGIICDILNQTQLRFLIHYTNLSLQHVNMLTR